VFLERAFQQFALAKFPGTWTGDEQNAQFPSLLPDAIDPCLSGGLLAGFSADEATTQARWFDPPEQAALERAHDLLVKHRPDLGRMPRPVRLNALMYRPLAFTVLEWRAAQEIAQREYNSCIDAIARWRLAQKEFVSLCEQGILKTVLRPLCGGEFSDVVSTGGWRLEEYLLRFITFQMDPNLPFHADVNLPNNQWIFVTRESLLVALAKVRRSHGVEEPVLNGHYETEFMCLMRKTIASLGISQSNQPKKSVVESIIRQHWDLPFPRSNIAITQMASFIRLAQGRDGLNNKRKETSAKG
jgi:hypothetical protein